MCTSHRASNYLGMVIDLCASCEAKQWQQAVDAREDVRQQSALARQQQARAVGLFVEAMAAAGNPGIHTFGTTGRLAISHAQGWMFPNPILRPALTDARGDTGDYARCVVLSTGQLGIGYDWRESIRARHRVAMVLEVDCEKRIDRLLRNPFMSDFWLARRPLVIDELVTLEGIEGGSTVVCLKILRKR